MKVTFIYPDFFQYSDGGFMPEGRIYLGIAYLSAVLKREGHLCSLIHLVAPPERDELLERIRGESPDLIGFSSTTHMFRHVAKWAGWIRDETDILTICGGVHPTIDPEEVLATRGIDIACRGESEDTLVRLCGALETGNDYAKIPGLWMERNGAVRRNPVGPLLRDLDSLPFPDRDIFDPALFCEDQHPRGTLMASRGCPFNCTYCSNHAQKSVYPDPENYVRFRSPENVVREIELMLASENSIEYIRFDDDVLTVDRSWLRELSDLYKARVGMPFICNSRVNFMDHEMAELLADMGCHVVCMGIESGNRWLREEVLKRRMSDEKILEAFRACRRAGMKTVSTNMVGLPLEDTGMVLDTIKLNAKSDPDTIQVSTFIPYPGTELFNLCKEMGLIRDRGADSIFAGVSPLKSNETGWEPGAVKANFHTLSFAYNRVLGLRPGVVSRAAVRCLDYLSTPGGILESLRKYLFGRVVGYAARRHEPEWIKY